MFSYAIIVRIQRGGPSLGITRTKVIGIVKAERLNQFDVQCSTGFVVVQEYDKDGLKRILNADQAFLDEGKWVFVKGVMYEVGSRGDVESVIRFEKEEMVTQQNMEDVLKSQKNPQEMSYKELKEYIAREHENKEQRYRLQLMLWQKTAIPFAAVLFAFVGVPLGIASPRSGK